MLEATGATETTSGDSPAGDAGPAQPARRSVDEVERLLDEVETALGRLDEGAYGTCSVCGGAIEETRLTSAPTGTRCATCDSDAGES